LKPIHTEAEIVQGCVRNDRTFQEILYRRHYAAMMQMCLRYANNDRERALEMLNDGFLRVFKKLDTFEFKGSLEGWIRRLVFHAISDYFKANKQYIESVVFEEPENETVQNGSLNNLYFDDILKIVETLPPATRSVFKLYAIDGYNHAEIAEQLNISVGTSKWHLSTAREKLKTMISKINTLRINSQLRVISNT
jgi:RNA polymerase sigma factor (sigma-70 family)